MPSLSVIIPNHNRCDALPLTMEAFMQQTFPAKDFEVIIVDQASTDDSRPYLQSIHPPFSLKIIQQESPAGPSIARNAGAKLALASVLIFSDSDMIPDNDFISAHHDANINHPDALICGRVLPHPGSYRTFVEHCANPEVGLDRGIYERALPFSQVFSNNISMSKETFQQVGDFDTGLRSYEDVEFGYRAFRSGLAAFNCPKAISYHYHPRTLDERLSQARIYQRNLPVIMQRYPEIRGKVPDFLPYETIHWRKDSYSLLRKKMRLRFFSTRPMLWVLRKTLDFMEKTHLSKRISRFCYWRLVSGCQFIGFTEGENKVQAEYYTPCSTC